jgi:hypothetical protein
MADWHAVSRTGLLHKLEMVRSGLAHEGVLDQSNSFIFRNGKVTTLNREMFCSATSELPPSYTAAIRSKPLFDLLKKASEDEIYLDLDNTLEFCVRLNGDTEDDFEESGFLREATISLPIESVDKVASWKPVPPKLIEALSQVSSCTDNKPNKERAYASCINLCPDWVEAFDNRQGCRFRLRTGIAAPIFVRAEFVNRMIPWEISHYAETNNWLHFRNQWGLHVAKRKLSISKFPDMTPYYGIKGVPIELPQILLDATEKAEIFANELKEKASITLDIRANKLRIEGQGVSGWYKKTKKIKYTGPDLKFTISPKMLINILERYDRCSIAKDILLVKDTDWTYIAAIKSKADSKEAS